MTWRRSGVLVIVTLVLSQFIGIEMASQRIFLTSSLFEFTGPFYIGLGILPAAIVLLTCLVQNPSGNRFWIALLPLLSAVIFCLYLTLIGPSFYSDIKCHSTAYVGLAVHQDCICQISSSSGTAATKCSLDGLRILPFVRLSEGK